MRPVVSYRERRRGSERTPYAKEIFWKSSLASSLSSSGTLSALRVSECLSVHEMELRAWVMFERQSPIRGLDLVWCRALLYLEYFVWVDIVWYVFFEVFDLGRHCDVVRAMRFE